MAPYNVSNPVGGPDQLGFPSGTYWDGKREKIYYKQILMSIKLIGTTVYPGTSLMGTTCAGNQAPGPTLIKTSGTVRPAGGYYCCSSKLN